MTNEKNREDDINRRIEEDWGYLIAHVDKGESDYYLSGGDADTPASEVDCDLSESEISLIRLIERDRKRIRTEAVKAEREALRAIEAWWRLPNSQRTIEAIEPAMKLVVSILSDDQEAAVCAWTYDEDDDSWDSSCGEKWQFVCDGPKENGVKFCHWCGKPVKEEGRG